MKKLIYLFIFLFSIGAYAQINQSKLSEAEFKHKVMQLEQKAIKGDVNAILALGNLYYSHFTNNQKNNNLKKSYFWFEKAAFKKHNVGMYNLGYFNEQGLSTRVSLKKAIRWYESSAKTGNPLSMFKLIKIYRNENTKNYDLEKATYWSTLFFKITKDFYESNMDKEENVNEKFKQHFNKFGIVNSEMLIEIVNFKPY
ncbi:MAG: hypothetical protein WD554_05600 [Flavobacteriaceae bacterium]